jgi:hypothetical protein
MKRPPNAGRKKGTPNKTTIAVKEFFTELFQDEGYRRGLIRRMKAGRASKQELYGLQLLGGRPAMVLEVPGLEALATTLRDAITGQE